MSSRVFNASCNILRNQISTRLFFSQNLIRYASTQSAPNSSGEQQQQQKKPKTVPVPKITLLTKDNVSVTTLEEAQKLSKRRDLKLVKIVDLDTKTQRPIYKLMTGAEFHEEDLKQREAKKKERLNDTSLKGEKVVILNAGISEHDLLVYANKVAKWIAKRYEVRFVVNGSSSMEKAEQIYNFMEDKLKDQARILQKRIKGNELKFQMIPPKKDKEGSGDNS